MPLPIDLIFVRHGESESNKAIRASRDGDHSLFTPEFRNRHSRTFRLTNVGIKQAQSAGEWIKKNFSMPFDRFYVSDYIRAKETAAYLNLREAEWRVDFQLRERDKALMDNLPLDEQERLFAREKQQHALDPFLSYPAGGGESIALLCLRGQVIFLEHLARECFDKKVIAVCHGHFMRALQMELEHLGHDDFIRLDDSEDPREKIRNCQILWYTRRDPDKGQLTSSHFVAVRSVCPWEINGDYGWRPIPVNLLSNEDLLREVKQHLRIVS